MFAQQPDLTYAEYLAYEHESKTKHEFVNGEAFAMAGASEDPDVMIVCDRTDNDAYVKQKPCLIVKVLSPSTAMLDRREKLFNYQKLESLQEYVLVSQSELKVELYRKDQDASWLVQCLGAGDSLHLQSIDLAIALSDIYEDVRL